MPRKRNSLKHDLFIAASKNITNNRTRTSYKRAITRFTKWAKEHNIKKKSDITEEVIQLYQLDLNDDPKQYSVATIHTYLAPVCKAVDINMNRVRKDKRSSDKIIRGRVKSKNSQGKHQETDSRFSRLVNFQRAVGIRRSELKKLKGKDIRKDNNGNYYVLVQRGKGGKFQPQLILPQDVPVILDTFKNKKEDDFDKKIDRLYRQFSKSSSFKKHAEKMVCRDDEKLKICNMMLVMSVTLTLFFLKAVLFSSYVVNFSVDAIVGCLAFVFSFINVRTKYRTLRRYNLVRDFIYLDGLSLLLCVLFKMFFPVQVDFSLIILLVDYYLCKKRFKEKAFKMLEAN